MTQTQVTKTVRQTGDAPRSAFGRFAVRPRRGGVAEGMASRYHIVRVSTTSLRLMQGDKVSGRPKAAMPDGISEGMFYSSLESILNENFLCSLATMASDGRPYVNTAFYARLSDLQLVIWTSPEATHSRNVELNSVVAVNIYDSHQSWGSELRGVQAFGTLRSATAVEALRCFAAYSGRFDDLMRLTKTYEDLERTFESRFYVFDPQRFKLLDEPGLGKENYVEVSLAVD